MRRSLATGLTVLALTIAFMSGAGMGYVLGYSEGYEFAAEKVTRQLQPLIDVPIGANQRSSHNK